MVEHATKLTTSGVLYVPKPIREAFGRHMKIIPNATAALFFPADAEYEDVLSSLEIITADVKHRLRMNERKAARKAQTVDGEKEESADD